MNEIKHKKECEYKDCPEDAEYTLYCGSFCITRVCRTHFPEIMNMNGLNNTRASKRDGWLPKHLLPRRAKPLISQVDRLLKKVEPKIEIKGTENKPIIKPVPKLVTKK